MKIADLERYLREGQQGLSARDATWAREAVYQKTVALLRTQVANHVYRTIGRQIPEPS